MKSLFYSLFVIGLSAALTHTHAAEQSVHLRPSADSPVLGSVERDAFLVAPAEPVTLSDREKERGWKAISYLADFRGFVRRPDVTKDLRVAPGAAVR